MFVKRIFGTSKSPDSLICKSVYTNIPLSLFQNFITQYLFNIYNIKCRSTLSLKPPGRLQALSIISEQFCFVFLHNLIKFFLIFVFALSLLLCFGFLRAFAVTAACDSFIFTLKFFPLGLTCCMFVLGTDNFRNFGVFHKFVTCIRIRTGGFCRCRQITIINVRVFVFLDPFSFPFFTPFPFPFVFLRVRFVIRFPGLNFSKILSSQNISNSVYINFQVGKDPCVLLTGPPTLAMLVHYLPYRLQHHCSFFPGAPSH